MVWDHLSACVVHEYILDCLQGSSAFQAWTWKLTYAHTLTFTIYPLEKMQPLPLPLTKYPRSRLLFPVVAPTTPMHPLHCQWPQ
ncbi:unnamed protein product [Arctogadus glacialis]